MSGYSGKSLETQESFHMLWKVLVNLESVGIDSRERGKFMDTLLVLWKRMLLKVSIYPGKFLDILKSLWILWRVSGCPGKFLDAM